MAEHQVDANHYQVISEGSWIGWFCHRCSVAHFEVDDLGHQGKQALSDLLQSAGEHEQRHHSGAPASAPAQYAAVTAPPPTGPTMTAQDLDAIRVRADNARIEHSTAYYVGSLNRGANDIPDLLRHIDRVQRDAHARVREVEAQRDDLAAEVDRRGEQLSAALAERDAYRRPLDLAFVMPAGVDAVADLAAALSDAPARVAEAIYDELNARGFDTDADDRWETEIDALADVAVRAAAPHIRRAALLEAVAYAHLCDDCRVNVRGLAARETAS